MNQQKMEIALNKIIPPSKIRESLLDNEFMSDVTFLLGKEGTPLKAHKILLMTSSSVMYRLFTKSTEQCLNIQIQQITKSTMLEICRFAYTEDVKLTTENMLELFYAASRFEMKILTEKAVDFICKKMSDKTVFKILEINHTQNNLRINMKCFDYIEKNYKLCLDNPELLKISRELLRTVLTTCKISPKSAMLAIKKWTKVNGIDDLDELMGIVSLKDFSDESDTEEFQKFESTNYTTSSSKTHEPNTTKTRSDIPKRNQPSLANNSTIPWNIIINKKNIKKSETSIFKISGNIVERYYKYANLDVTIGCQNISLQSIQFIYDLKKYDTEFEISLIEVEDNRRTTLYKNKVVFSSRTKGPFTYFDFMQKIELQAGKKIWFKIGFPRPLIRTTYADFDTLRGSKEKDIILRSDYSYEYFAEIINSISYIIS